MDPLLKRPRVEQRAERLVLVTGAARGLGVGICRQILRQDERSEVLLAVRNLEAAEELAEELGARARPLSCDVTSEVSCQEAAKKVAEIRAGRPLTLVNNAGVGLDLPWFPPPWPATAARETLAVNILGVHRLTQALLPQLLDAESPGRIVFVSSGAGTANTRKMSAGRRSELLNEQLTWARLEALIDSFIAEYEIAAAEQTVREVMPFLSSTGFWLQSYGFSKACLNVYCRLLARQHPTLLCTACSPGFVETDMVRTYKGGSKLRSVEEGGEVCARLACCDGWETGCYYNSDGTLGDIQ
eukprot:TRINITY_DN105891_c0_g1_i1.p1 TRINITY_DN105891_c0_g1~~TRINITY_DN105891_c0_g1_i1.p1  ORF type:complete len:300 (-),score=38.19 TRINITY_DN105891_c0_g1_i1:261-1160(-)